MTFARDFYIMAEFRAKSQNGVLLYGSSAAGNSDGFFAVLLVDGYLQLRLDFIHSIALSLFDH